MKIVSLLLASALAVSTTAAAHTSGPHFFKAGDVVDASGWGNINGNDCVAHATVTVGPDVHGPGPHAQHADYADVKFTNINPPCDDYEVTARIYPNGDVSDVSVYHVPSNTYPCVAPGVVGTVTYTTTPTAAGDTITNASIFGLAVGPCVLSTSVTVDYDPVTFSPAIVN